MRPQRPNLVSFPYFWLNKFERLFHLKFMSPLFLASYKIDCRFDGFCFHVFFIGQYFLLSYIYVLQSTALSHTKP